MFLKIRKYVFHPYNFKWILMFILIAQLGNANCSGQTEELDLNADGACTVEEVDEGGLIRCPDGSEYLVRNGDDGLDCESTVTEEGVVIDCGDGRISLINHGSDCSTSEDDDGVNITCDDGSHSFIEHGSDGLAGKDGLNAQPCEVFELDKDLFIECPGGDRMLLRSGENLVRRAYDVIEVIDPCGPETRFDEVLLRFASGDILAHYSNGRKKEHLVRVPAGNYQTTDGTNCRFAVSPTGEVTW